MDFSADKFGKFTTEHKALQFFAPKIVEAISQEKFEAAKALLDLVRSCDLFEKDRDYPTFLDRIENIVNRSDN